MFDDEGMDEIRQIFLEESTEGLDVMESGLLELEPGTADMETINNIFRAAHSIKGGGGTFGFVEVSDFTHWVETVLDEMRSGERDVTEDGITLLLESVDCLRGMMDSINAQSDYDTPRISALQARIVAVLNGEADTGVAAVPTLEAAVEPEPAVEEQPSVEPTGNVGVETVAVESAAEFDKTLAAESVVETSAEPSPPEVSIETDAAVEETAVAPDVESEAAVIPEPENKAPEATPAPAAKTAEKGKAEKGGSESGSSIRVNVDKVDSLLNLVGELVITQSMLGRFKKEFNVNDISDLRDGLAQLESNTRELQEAAMQIRMLPIKVAFSRFTRLVRDLSRNMGKKVKLELLGEQTELDKTVLEKIGDPLVHLVRNSLDHGIETVEKRLAAGKPAEGLLRLSAYHEAGNIVIEISDDGAGLNRDKILSKAIERGLVGEDEQITDDRIYMLIFQAGFSTADQISDLSGRGVGMDVVRRNIQDLGGRIDVYSEIGKGSTFTIRLPLTLAILDGQLVRVGDETYIVPLLSIVESVFINPERVNVVANNQMLYRLRDEFLPITDLRAICGGYYRNMSLDVDELDDKLLVVIETAGRRYGLVVDDLEDQQQVVIKALENNYRHVSGLAGATILGDGSVALILDIPSLAQRCFNELDEPEQQASA
jgi:two-component system, chemotaxis family, sensor kinase CheA